MKPLTLDVRTKILVVVLANISFLCRLADWREGLLVLGMVLLLALCASWKVALGYLAYFLVILICEPVIESILMGHFNAFLLMIFMVGRIGLPSFMAGHLILTTTTSYDLVHGLRKWHLPESLLLTLAVMQGFLPRIKKDSQRIHTAMKTRGLLVTGWDKFRHPLRYGEYVLVPLLMALMYTAQDLTIGVLTKGMVLHGGGTTAFPTRFRTLDWSVCLWIFVMLILIVLL